MMSVVAESICPPSRKMHKAYKAEGIEVLFYALLIHLLNITIIPRRNRIREKVIYTCTKYKEKVNRNGIMLAAVKTIIDSL